MKEIIYYKQQSNRQQSGEYLREISLPDQDYVKLVMQCYIALAEVDPRPEFREWFDMPNPKLPKLKDQGSGFNSPRTWCQGIIEKLSRAPTKRDLSPRQCNGIQALSEEISIIYDLGLCPSLAFVNKLDKITQSMPTTTFGKLFK
jgi:hypothetical protein